MTHEQQQSTSQVPYKISTQKAQGKNNQYQKQTQEMLINQTKNATSSCNNQFSKASCELLNQHKSLGI